MRKANKRMNDFLDKVGDEQTRRDEADKKRKIEESQQLAVPGEHPPQDIPRGALGVQKAPLPQPKGGGLSGYKKRQVAAVPDYEHYQMRANYNYNHYHMAPRNENHISARGGTVSHHKKGQR